MTRSQLAVLAIAFLLPSTAFAGGWTQEEGGIYSKIWANAVIGNQLFDLEGDLQPSESFSLVSLQTHTEYGLRPDLTLIASLQPIGVASHADQTRATMGKMMLGFRQRFLDDGLQLALEARFGGSPGFGGDRDMAPAQDYEFRPTMRSYYSEWDLQLGLPVGTVGWATAGFGPRWAMNDELSHAIGANGQIGFGPFAGFVFDAHVQLHHTFEAPTVVNVTGAGNTRYFGFGLGVSWWATDHFAVNAAFEGAAYAKSNAGAPSLNLGIELRN